ncbi:type VI secretion system baseplate subunit TssG [Achromobacter marplatensis]|uniref:type VI secretion system baseplate subunit TssG n=1 Tax=Achromobacter marplatensis TaxID=470868 RepID=UPI0039F6D479
MPPVQRRRDPSVIEALLAEPQRFKFFQAVRVLELWFARQEGTRAKNAVPAHLRFLNSSSLGFPASEIAALMAYDKDGVPLEDTASRLAALAEGKLGRVEIEPAFFGLLGGQGALPLHYSEILSHRESAKRDRGARAFFDIFSNRASALFYAAWKKYRMPIRHETEQDHHYLPLLLALGGIGHPALRDRLHQGDGQVFDESLAHYAAAARQRPVSAAFLQRVLCDYFQVDMRVEQFVGRWYHVPPEHRTQLGMPGAVLGVSAMAGDRIWQRDLRIRLWIGPLSRAAFADFLPGGARAQALEKLLTMFGGMSFEYEVRLIMAQADVAGSVLGGEGEGARLGWNSFLCTAPVDADRDDASYELHTIH